VEAFLVDESPNAFEKVVDRLLASSHFGERWARHWLDLVRYAESRGHENDYSIPNAYQYRDYAVRALNADVPYDQLVTEHIAGDLLDRPRLVGPDGSNESILGTGFWFLGEEVHSPVDVRQDELDRLDNMIDVMSKTFLGLTVSCARCHDHKFDAISSKDYYSLLGYLEGSSYRLACFDTMEHNRRVADQLAGLQSRFRAPLQRAIADSWQPVLRYLCAYLRLARGAILSARKQSALGDNEGNKQAIVEYTSRLTGVPHTMDRGVAQRWIAHLAEAAADPSDPFYPWAKVCQDASAESPEKLANLLRPIRDAWQHQETETLRTLQGAEIVIDYSTASRDSWMSNGVTFGLAPTRPGDIRLGTETAQPVAGFATEGAAEQDPVWSGLRPAMGSEKEPGALGDAIRAGRTIRTPSFQLKKSKLWYRIKGRGFVYAAVDSHRLIAGPLHGQLIKKIDAGEKYRWVVHDLSTYQGQRVHVEFTPTVPANFAVALVVQADGVPGSLSRPNAVLRTLVSNESAKSLEALLDSYHQLFSDVAEKVRSEQVVGSPHAADLARLADWMVRHGSLFLENETAFNKWLASEMSDYYTDRRQLSSQIRNESRLALAMLDGNSVDEHVLLRGSHKTPGELAPHRFLEALAGPLGPPASRGSGRLDLARQITDPAINPFLARVMANRIWHHLFGQGIVASTDNFGALGDRPTHPELLDYLADRFIRDGWSIKRLIRSLVLSRAYRMSSRQGERADEIDPDNRLLHRMRLRRLEGEAIRDALLGVAGRLNDKMFGPSVPPYLSEFQGGRGRPESGPLDGNGRRSIYLGVRRNFLSPMMLAFDTPIPFSTVGRRSISNVPGQALILMNDGFVHQQAENWAATILAQPASQHERISRMYQSAFARPPTKNELAACEDFLQQQGATPDAQSWTALAHVLFNTKEFIFLD
jgi:hypothetical protein